MSDDKGRRNIAESFTDTKKTTPPDLTAKMREEVENLVKKGRLSNSDVMNILIKYGDESLLDEYLRAQSKRFNKMTKQAKKIARKIHKKYLEGKITLHELYDTLLRFKSKNKWTDEEFAAVWRELTGQITGQGAYEIDCNQNLSIYRSKINRALGNIVQCQTIVSDGLRIKDSEKPVVEKILKKYVSNLALHRAISLQAMIYEDCSILAMTGSFDRTKHIASNHISPVLACMFLPKISIFEEYMLHSNFAGIIKARHEKKPISNVYDFQLAYAISQDPNDVVCKIDSPIVDIKNRSNVQCVLWELVLPLRSGRYYDSEPISKFMKALDKCRNNIYDNADLIYNQDEGKIIRILTTVFSLRPTIIYTRMVSSFRDYFPGMYPTEFPFSNQPAYTITNIAMIHLQIPPAGGDALEPKDLRTATSQLIWINGGGVIIPKEQAVIYSREVLIFYVNRRYQQIRTTSYLNLYCFFSQIPMSMSSMEQLNNYPVNVPDRITIGGRSDDVFLLRSIVAVSVTNIVQRGRPGSVITGSVGLIMKHGNLTGPIFDSQYYMYDPYGASIPIPSPEKDGYFNNKPISIIPSHFSPPENEGTSFFELASRKGTIFIYAKPPGCEYSQAIITI